MSATSKLRKKEEKGNIRYLPLRRIPQGVIGTPVEGFFDEMAMRKRLVSCTDSNMRPTLGASITSFNGFSVVG